MKTDKQRIDCLEATVQSLVVVCFYLMDPEHCTPPQSVREYVMEQLDHFLDEQVQERASRN